MRQVTVYISDVQREALGDVARRLGLMNPKRPAEPSLSALMQRIGASCAAEPEPAIALIATTIGIDDIQP